MPAACPDCGEPDLLLRGFGTKELEKLLASHLAPARILRVDQDSRAGVDNDAIYRAMHSGEADIIVGTQMITKGFDLPRVTMVGIIHADAALSLPDFAAAERTFQLLYQVMGRGGRHLPRHHVVVQTYRPDHPALRHALARDWSGFYTSELAARRQGGFPPHNFLMQVLCRHKSPEGARRTLERIAEKLPPGVRSLGPGPAFHARSGPYYRWQLVLFAKKRTLLVNLARELPGSCQADLDPIDLL
jgi:primosomal protein N' (replication factor Y)